ncbi:MAG TPA: ribonuclease III [Desulfurobacteriaceae bacterium]|nr:ribonuclease III [Desulfurobacteriaceae bacterium]
MKKEKQEINPLAKENIYKNLENLEKIIGYTFKNKELLRKALTHPSFSSDYKTDNYEVLEFLGDSVVGLIVSEKLIEKFPKKREGELSKYRALIVSEQGLARLARKINLGDFLILGKTEIIRGGRERDSNLCDAFEALFGAIYLDSDLDTTRKIFLKHFEKEIFNILKERKIKQDYKSYLQELTQKYFNDRPTYKIIEERGPEHQKTYVVKCTFKEFVTIGEGSSKKNAEQKAAQKMIEKLEAYGYSLKNNKKENDENQKEN